jgi:hypothetical protein
VRQPRTLNLKRERTYRATLRVRKRLASGAVGSGGEEARPCVRSVVDGVTVAEHTAHHSDS